MTDFMVFMLSCMFIHALLTHNPMLVLTEEHQIFLMKMTLSGKTCLSSRIRATVFVGLIFT